MLKILLTILLLLIPVNSLAEYARWEKADKNIHEAFITSVIIATPDKTFASTKRYVYLSEDNTETWSLISFFKQGSIVVNDLAYLDGAEPALFIATTNGLYSLDIKNKKTKRIFKPIGKNKKNVVFVKATGNNIYIGTRDGIFVKGSGKWQKLNYLKSKKINDIAFLKSKTILAANDGIYKGTFKNSDWRRVYSLSKADNGNYIENENHDNNYMYRKEGVTSILYDERMDIMYAGTKNGVLISRDDGESWGIFTIEGLLSKSINDISVAGKDKLLATGKGLYKYVMVKNDKKNEISNKSKFSEFLKGQIRIEPGVLRIQKAAIKYAEVGPEKIEWMRNAVKSRAWFPELDVDIDYDEDNNINIDRGSSSVSDVFIAGPQDRSWGWGISLNWDLGDIVWNDDQTNIDVRSRLMVQLRDDILTEITTLYFERRRLQQDIINKPVNEQNATAKLMKLQELTARIDALTGGYLSKNGGGYEDVKI